MTRLALFPVLAILILGLAGCMGAHPTAPSLGPTSSASDTATAPVPSVGPAATSGVFQTQSVCFTGDFTKNVPQVNIVMAGTLYRPGTLGNQTRSIVLVHGWDSTANGTFDGGPAAFGVANQTTLARTLASAGYAVFLVDRLGMGRNPYPDGDKLSVQSYVELTGHIVDQVKAGTYHTTAAGCPGDGPAPFKSSSVVIGGHSYGGFIAQALYQTTAAADGLLSLDVGSFALAPDVVAGYADCGARAFAADPLASYFPALCTRDYCMHTFFNMPGYDAKSADSICDPAKQVPDARGVASDAPWAHGTAVERPMRSGPVLLLYAECPAAFNIPPCDPTIRDAVTAGWKNGCPNCTVTTRVLPGVAHFYMYYPAANAEANRVILEWLASSGLGPMVG